MPELLMMEQKTSRPRKQKSLKKIRYRPDRLFDTLLKRLKLGTDAELARLLEVVPAVISKTRNKQVPVSAGLLVRLHEVSKLSIQELRSLMGDGRQRFSPYKAETSKRREKQKDQGSVVAPESMMRMGVRREGGK